jgi:SpoIIAA-like
VIEELKDFPENVVGFACRGHVTRVDYENVLVPAVEKAFKEREKVRLYYEIRDDFEGIDPSAVWTDFKTGVEHWLSWERIAVVTDVEWIRSTMWAFSFLMPAQMKVFPLSKANEARDWIVSA